MRYAHFTLAQALLDVAESNSASIPAILQAIIEQYDKKRTKSGLGIDNERANIALFQKENKL